MLDSDQLADPDVRAKVIRARDLPAGFGDMDASLYLLFKAIREHSTVALSGESADEVFGGYRQFHDPRAAQRTPSPGWPLRPTHFEDTTRRILDAGADAPPLDLDGYVQDSYADGDRGGPSAWTARATSSHRMREICYLHLTRFVRVLLDRKDRMSMAVGLEVRVPFCDHRLVEYVYNTPWSLKTFDGREKSLLRGGDGRRAAALGVQPGQEPVPVHAGPAVRCGPPVAGQRPAGQ